MEKGRTAGSYFLFILREGLYRMKTELFGWRGLLLLAIGGYVVLDTVTAVEEYGQLMFQGLGAFWLVILFPPRMGKLLYLLPFTRKDRIRYLRNYSVSYVAFYVMLFITMGAVACLISGYSMVLWLRHFVLCTFPFMLLYSGVVVDSMSVAVQKSYPATGWFFSTRNCWQQKTDRVAEIREDCGAVTARKAVMSPEEKEKAKKQSKFMVKTAICSVVPAIHGFGSYMYAGLYVWWPWLIYVLTVLAYLSALIGLYLYWNRISEEMGRTGNTGKEESVCNS